MFGRNKIAALVAEFLGTGILTLLVLSVQRSTIGVPFFVALAAGLTIAVMYFALGEVSGAQFNPALSFALWTARKLSTAKMVLYIAVHMLGAWAAYALYTYFANNTLQPIGGHFTWLILVAEGVGAFVFAFGWAATVYRGYTTPTKASIAGISYTVGVVAASAAAIGLVNPALALGVRAWVWGSYVLGPVIGAVIAVNLYGLLFATASDVEPPLVAVAATVAPSAAATAVTTATRKPRKSAATAASKTTAAKKTTKKPAAKRASRSRS
jgi:aquaporin NIP